MSWHTAVWHWLAQAALGGSLVLLAGCLAVRLSRQPVRRLRLIELTLLGALVVPWLAQAPMLPHWSAGLLGDRPQAQPEPELASGSSFVPAAPPASSASVPETVRVGPA